MNMQINIKNAKARELADELVELTGESLTDAITAAIAQRLRLLKRDELTAKWDKIMVDNRATLDPEWLGMDHDADMYDDAGLPK